MSYFMDYGPDWPPSPERPKRRRRWPLWKTCAAWTAGYLLIAGVGLIAVSVIHTDRITRITISDTPAPASGITVPGKTGAHR